MAAKEKSVHDEVQSFLGDIDTDNLTASVAPAEEEDDEFERLLQEFISTELTEDDKSTIENDARKIPADNKPLPSAIEDEDGFAQNLYEEEKALYNAHRNFTEAINEMALQAGLDAPKFIVTAETLYPRYKPAVGESFARDTLTGWDVMIKVHPTRIMNITPNARDEELLEFAEKTTDETLQTAVISYVEILIEIESCEIAYEKRRLKAKRKRIERQVYEEHQRRLEKINRYIEAIRKKEFPVNAERLVMNYFKTSRKDADGAFKMLTNNPATFAPIEVSKIKARFFGLIKARPEDGIRINKELGKFLKNLKV